MAELKVVYNERIAPGCFKIGLSSKGGGGGRGGRGGFVDRKAYVPGQFVMVKVSDGEDPLLRRPFSIYSLIPGRGQARGIELIYKVVGRGTEIMSRWEPGHMVDVIGPLGNGFPEPPPDGKILMVAGGIGIASFYMFSKRHKGATLLFGARGRGDTRFLKDFRELGTKIRVATEDGSVGEKGLVTKLVKKELSPDTIVYASGPTAMLRAVSELAQKKGARCFVSMERSMACGMGACMGCAVKMKKGGYRMACSEGPVFDSEEIEW